MSYHTHCECCRERFDARHAPADIPAMVCPDCEAVLREHRDAILSDAELRRARQ